MNELQLDIPKRDCNIAIVAGEFNHFIVQQLVDGALDALDRNGVPDSNISLAWVPGAFELPLAADVLAASGQHDAVLALGAVIRGGTPHFDYVAGECSRGLAQVGLKHDMPVIFGVLTTVAAFSPMLFVPGANGKIWRVIPLVVIPALLFSMVESKFILPSHLSHYHGGSKRGGSSAT